MTNIRLTAHQRDALKSALRNHPEVKALGLRIVGTKDELLALAERFNVAIPEPMTAQDAFDDDADDAVVSLFPTNSDQHEATENDKIEELVQKVLKPMGQGDFAGFQTELRSMAMSALKPAQVIHLPAVAPVTCKGHVPQIIEKSTAKKLLDVTGPFEAIPMARWDAPDAPARDDHYVWPEETGAILTQLRRGRNVLMSGPAGTGKTSFAKELAARTGRPYVRISCTEQTDAATLVGMTVPKAGGGVEWQDGQLAAAIRRPGTVILVDEPSVARPGALFVLQSVLDDARALSIEETGERVPVAQGVIFMLADNTAGTGDETGAYEGTRRLNRAFLDRCGVTAAINYLPADKEAAVLQKRTGAPLALCNLAVKYATETRAAATAGKITHGVGLRRLLAWCELVADGVAHTEAYELAMHRTAAPDDREQLRALYRAHVSTNDVQAARK